VPWPTKLRKSAETLIAGSIRGDSEKVLPLTNEMLSIPLRMARTFLAGELLRDVATMPVAKLTAYFDWVGKDDAIKDADRLKLAEILSKRWDAEKDPETKDRFGQLLIRILKVIGTEQWLAFLRTQHQTAPEDYRETYARRFFDALLSQPRAEEARRSNAERVRMRKARLVGIRSPLPFTGFFSTHGKRKECQCGRRTRHS